MIKGDRIYVKRGLYAGEYGTFLSSELVFKDGRYQDICFVKLDRHRFTEVMLSRFDMVFVSRNVYGKCPAGTVAENLKYLMGIQPDDLIKFDGRTISRKEHKRIYDLLA